MLGLCMDTVAEGVSRSVRWWNQTAADEVELEEDGELDQVDE